MGHNPVVLVCMASRAVQLYVSTAVNPANILEGRQSVNKWFTPHSNLHTALSLADTISKAPQVMSQCSSLHGERQNPHSTARRVTMLGPAAGPFR